MPAPNPALRPTARALCYLSTEPATASPGLQTLCALILLWPPLASAPVAGFSLARTIGTSPQTLIVNELKDLFKELRPIFLKQNEVCGVRDDHILLYRCMN